MLARLAADAALFLHLIFIAFAVFGAILAFRWRWIPLLQLPAAAWGVYVELSGSLCPLTHLENYFRMLAGQGDYPESFVEHYLLKIIYPTGLTREVQFVLAAAVIVMNTAIYGLIFWRRRRVAAR